jgi:hypothetical protein
MTRGAEASDMQPSIFVTVKVCEPTGIAVIEILVPEPAVVIAPGLRVSIQLPAAGNPFIVALPVTTEHVVCITEPITGAAGVGEMITWVVAVVFPHPPDAAIVYVTVYVPALLVPVVIEPLVASIDKPPGAE